MFSQWVKRPWSYCFGKPEGGCSTTPIAVKGLTGVTAISAGYEHTCARLGTGTVKCWGDNTGGELGNGTYTGPQMCLNGPCSSTPIVKGLTETTAVAVGEDQACALLSTGTAKCWGQNSYGELGNGTTTHSLVPVSVKGLTGATAIAAGDQQTCALLSTGTVKCWGDNTYGQLGNGTATSSPVPVAVTGL